MNHNHVPTGSSVCPCVVVVSYKQNVDSAFGYGDTELLATIEAGKRLRDALTKEPPPF